MKIIGRFDGKLGAIAIWENQADGSRFYVEGDIFQSHSPPSGESLFTYIKVMDTFLREASSVLVLGCGGGNLATMLAGAGKAVTVVDHDSISFDIARDYFGMPKDIPCVVEDFREYLSAETRHFDGIAIDVGGQGFCFEERFDSLTCRSIKERLGPNGRMIMNLLVGNDFDATPDKIGNHLADDHLDTWIFDEPKFINRNALIACLPKVRGPANRRYVAELCQTNDVRWTPREPRRRSNNNQSTAVNIISYD